MAEEDEQNEQHNPIEARADTSPEPLEAEARGNRLSEPDQTSSPGDMPPPLKH